MSQNKLECPIPESDRTEASIVGIASALALAAIAGYWAWGLKTIRRQQDEFESRDEEAVA